MLYFEGERSYQFRILRSIKNRFGSTSETGIFAMVEEGLQELSNPSASLLAERSDEESGSAVMIYLEGVRPILVEVHSLVVTSAFGMPRRTRPCNIAFLCYMTNDYSRYISFFTEAK